MLDSNRFLIIDGNSIMNRAFYGIMSSKMLTAPDGTYTNAIYGFLAILFKELEDLKPEYIAVAFDLKAPTHRHKMYDGYKATRHQMPEELAQQMPIIKEILRDMNITIIEKEGFEADDVLGTMSKKAEDKKIDVTILSGDRDTFQLATDKITIRIPRTKAGKTEEDDFNRDEIIKNYGVEPRQLIQVKGLMGDTSDNIPGVPGIGEKTALKLIKEYGTIDKLYEALDAGTADVKGALKDKLVNNKDLAYLSKMLGEILLDAPLDIEIEDLKVQPWDNEKVTEKFKKLRFNRFIERFNLNNLSNMRTTNKSIDDLLDIEEINFETEDISKHINDIKSAKELIYHFKFESCDNDKIINKKITSMSIYNKKENKEVYIYNIDKDENKFIHDFKEVFESDNIRKVGYDLSIDYVILKQLDIDVQNLYYDAEIAGYDINPANKNTLEELAKQYLYIDIDEYIALKFEHDKNEKSRQITLFENTTEEDANNERDQNKYKEALNVYIIGKLLNITIEKLKEIDAIDLFENIEMPLVQILGSMQYEGMYVDKSTLSDFGEELKSQIERLTYEIYYLAGEEFNINSHQQLGRILFEKLSLPSKKKTKSGYSTDVDVLEKIRNEHPIVEKVLEYRTLTKLNSTYVEGLLQYINPVTNKIHSYFHQTITATGRISSTEPNLQNIPTRAELGKNIRKAFKPKEGNVYIDADYSQIELRVLAHISQDENMIEAFRNGEDIHRQAASKVFNIPIEEVTKEQRSSAKAVNFGIVYGISDFGLANQIGVSNKKAKEYIEQYLEKYSGIKHFMEDIVERAKVKGYVETLYHRRRYVPELKSNNYMVRQFGSRVAMNTPIQGTAADIMKIAMKNVYKELKKNKLNAKIILQIHDELLIEVSKEDKEKAKLILKECMTDATKLSIPLEVEVSEGENWYEVK